MNYEKGEIGKRPWGRWRVDELGEGFVKKTIFVDSGASLSLQSHEHRSEKWEVLAGIAEVTVDGKVQTLKLHEVVEIPVKVIHRLKNIGTEPLIIKETQFGEILDEDDIIRYEDLYGRYVDGGGIKSSIVFLADMDGTLTPARLPMSGDFVAFFSKFIASRIFYIVSGSNYEKVQEQIPGEILHAVAGVYVSMGNEFYARGKLVHKNDFIPEKSLLEKLERYRSVTKYPFELYPNYIEKRCGMVNFSVLGRNCPYEARVKYNDWDSGNKEREKIARELSEDYPQYDVSVGGSISIDIVFRGLGKEQVADQLRSVYKTEKIVFLGDRTEKNGNDYALAQKLLASGNAEVIPVNGPDDVAKILKGKYE